MERKTYQTEPFGISSCNCIQQEVVCCVKLFCILYIVIISPAAGLLLQGCIFSSLMRPLTGRRRKPPKEADIHTAPTIVVTPIQEENSGVAQDSMKHFQPTEVIELKPRARYFHKTKIC